jgi:hypothetical protein
METLRNCFCVRNPVDSIHCDDSLLGTDALNSFYNPLHSGTVQSALHSDCSD